MDKQRRKLLDDILKYASKRGIVIPDDILLEISKQDAEKSLELLKKENKEINPDLIFGLMRPGLVPAPLQPGLTLKSQGWERVAEVPYPTFPSGGGSSGGGVKDHNLLNNLDYASAGHTGFAPALGADDNYVTDAEKLALHPAVTLDVNADTILSNAAQVLGLDTQAAGRVLAGPTAGAAAVPTFRALVASDIPTSAPEGTYLISGGGVTWKSDYIYTVAAGTGYINGVLYSWAQQDITLDAADALLDRIDMVGVDSTSTVFKVTGDAAADPSEPVVDPSTQLELAFVLVTANTTEPVGITSELIYAENVGSPTEWDWTTSGVGFNVNSATNPRTGAKDIEGTNVAANAYALATRGAGTIDPSDYTQLVFYIRFKSSWNASRYLQIQMQNAGVKKGNALRISNGQFGLVGTNTTDYQAVIIPVLQFAVPTGTLINQIRIIDVGGSIGFYIDDVSITTGGAGGTVITGITQDEADARYVQISQVTSDITTLNASTSSHGLIIKPVAPAAGLTTIPAIENGETVWKNKALFDTTNPAALGVAAPGTQLIAARRDHVHAAPATTIWPVTKLVSNPQLVYTQRAQVVLFRAPAALTITRIHIVGNDSTPTAELAGDLKWADDVSDGSFANATVIDVCDTTNGVFTATSSFDDATIASGKYVYFQMDASPHADWKDFYIEVYYTLD